MANITQPDLDDLARDMGSTLDMVEYALHASKSPDIDFTRKPNFSKALTDAVAVESVAEFILHQLQDSDIDNRKRFTALSADASKLIKRFWANFQLLNIHRMENANGNAKSVGVPQSHKGEQQPVLKRGEAIRGVNKNVTGRGKGNRIGEDIVREIKQTIQVHYGGKLTIADMKAIAEAYNIGWKSIENLYYRYTYADIE